MDFEKYLILVKGKDKTKKIKSFNRRGNSVDITYSSNGKTYHFAQKNAEIYKDPLVIRAGQSIVLVNGKQKHGMQYAQFFERHVRIVFSSSESAVFNRKNVQIVESGLGDKQSND